MKGSKEDVMNDFEVIPVTRYELWRNGGMQVVDEHGQPVNYATREEAEFVAATWEMQRAPTWGELQELTDDELRDRSL